MCFYFFGHIFRNDLIKLIIRFINFLYTMIDKRNKISGITDADDHTGAILGML